MTREAVELSSTDARRRQQGRGKGTKSDYTPWILIHEVSSKGRKHLVPGYKTGREHHLLSDGEAACLSVLEWHPAVLDIREQYPLLPLESTIDLADRLGIQHPLDPKNGVHPFVLTIDFLLTISDDNNTPFKAISFKRASQLENRVTQMRQELERRYLSDHGIENREVDWIIVTENEIPHILVKNLAQLSPRTFSLGTQERLEMIQAALELRWRPTITLTDLASGVDRELDLDLGTSLSVIRQLIYHGLWVFDLRNTIFKINRPMSKLSIDQSKKLPAWGILP